MPTYEYECTDCSHQFEQFQSMSEKPIRKCPKCKKNSVEKRVSAGAGIIFRGTGFYETDYKRAGEKKTDEKKTDDSKTSSKTETTKSESA